MTISITTYHVLNERGKKRKITIILIRQLAQYCPHAPPPQLEVTDATTSLPSCMSTIVTNTMATSQDREARKTERLRRQAEKVAEEAAVRQLLEEEKRKSEAEGKTREEMKKKTQQQAAAAAGMGVARGEDNQGKTATAVTVTPKPSEEEARRKREEEDKKRRAEDH